jgi:hypothetical protein
MLTIVKDIETDADFDTLKTKQGTGVVYVRYYPTDAFKSREIPRGDPSKITRE